METALDLLIQDFVTTNKLVNQNVTWDTMVSRRFENGRVKVFQYSETKVAKAEHKDLADGEWLVITLDMVKGLDSDSVEYRFDCLKLMHAVTHYSMTVEKEERSVTVKLLTRNRGLMNVMFVISMN